MNKRKMNKHGAMEIVLLVLLVLLVILVALFNFIVGSKSIQANIYDARFIEEVYQKQDLAEFYIRQVGEEVIVKNSGDFSESFKAEFSKYNFAQDNLKELQKIISEGGFNVRTAPKGVPPDPNGMTSDTTGMTNGDVGLDGGLMQDGILGGNNVLEITINSWEVKDSFEEIEVTYYPKISLEFDLE